MNTDCKYSVYYSRDGGRVYEWVASFAELWHADWFVENLSQNFNDEELCEIVQEDYDA